LLHPYHCRLPSPKIKKRRTQAPLLIRGKKVLKLEAKARELLKQGIGIDKVARTIGLGVGTVHQIKRDMSLLSLEFCAKW
jgi:hypothetical protein